MGDLFKLTHIFAYVANLKALEGDVKYMMYSINCMQFELFCVGSFKCLCVEWGTSKEAFNIFNVRKQQIKKTLLIATVLKPT